MRQRITELEARKAELEIENAEIPELRKKLAELEARNAELIKQITEENNRHDARILKLEQDQAERESKKNHKFQTRCIQIAKEILSEEPIIEYCPPFLNGLELDAFFQKYRIALIVIPERIRKIKEFVNQAFKSFDLL